MASNFNKNHKTKAEKYKRSNQWQIESINTARNSRSNLSSFHDGSKNSLNTNISSTTGDATKEPNYTVAARTSFKESQHTTNKYQSARKNRRSRFHKNNVWKQQSSGTGYNCRGYKVGNNNKDSTSNETNSNRNNIPGFYYDATSKKYFCIAPDQNNDNSYTMSAVKLKIQEENSKENAAKEIKLIKKTLVHHIRELELGGCTARQYKRTIETHRLKKLREVHREKHSDIINHVEPPNMNDPNGERANGSIGILSYPGMSSFYCDWRHPIKNVGTFMNVSTRKVQSDDECRLKFSLTGNCISYSANNIKDACWARMGSNYDYILSLRDKVLSYCYSATLFPLRGGTPPQCGPEFPLGSCAWSCAWSDVKNLAGFGLQNVVKVFNLQNNGYDLVKEVPLHGAVTSAVAFSNSGREFYAGTNTGYLQSVDMREYSGFSDRIGVGGIITRLQPLSKDFKILCAASNNVLCLVDLRNEKIVQEYPGHKSEHKKLSLSVDEDSDSVCGVGSDGWTRIWNISSGELLHQIPAPNPLHTLEYLPQICLKSDWAKANEIGLIMAVQNDLILYQS